MKFHDLFHIGSIFDFVLVIFGLPQHPCNTLSSHNSLIIFFLWVVPATRGDLYLQEETAGAGFNALTSYILSCMILIASALMYYGLILCNSRKISKVDMKANEKGAQQMTNSIIKLDRLMLVAYVIIFLLFNVCYFISNLA